MSGARDVELLDAVLVAVLVPAGAAAALDPDVVLWAPELLGVLELLRVLELLEPPQAAESKAVMQAMQARTNSRRLIGSQHR
ncbi:MAG: hypothetical protein ACR2MK_07900 [Solirubrobacteraceae bacterium]